MVITKYNGWCVFVKQADFSAQTGSGSAQFRTICEAFSDSLTKVYMNFIVN